jgi:hypothetical protein
MLNYKLSCLQIDGGSENANASTLALAEYLVYRRLTRKVVITRLPPGHTHEVRLNYDL